MQRFPGSLGLLLDAINYPGPDGPVVGNILTFLGIFEFKKPENASNSQRFRQAFFAPTSRVMMPEVHRMNSYFRRIADNF